MHSRARADRAGAAWSHGGRDARFLELLQGEVFRRVIHHARTAIAFSKPIS